jgi:hypothetical protein
VPKPNQRGDVARVARGELGELTNGCPNKRSENFQLGDVERVGRGERYTLEFSGFVNRESKTRNEFSGFVNLESKTRNEFSGFVNLESKTRNESLATIAQAVVHFTCTIHVANG